MVKRNWRQSVYFVTLSLNEVKGKGLDSSLCNEVGGPVASQLSL